MTEQEAPKKDWRKGCMGLAAKRSMLVAKAILAGSSEELETEMIQRQYNRVYYRRNHGDEGIELYGKSFNEGLKAFAETHAKEQNLMADEVASKIFEGLKTFMEANRYHS